SNAVGATPGTTFGYDAVNRQFWIVKNDNTVVKRSWSSATTTAVPLNITSGGTLPGVADLAIGPNRHSVWVTATNGTPAHWNPEASTWDAVGGGGQRVDVGAEGQVWIVGTDNAIYSMDWFLRGMPEAAVDVATGADGSVWAVGTNAFSADGNQVYLWN